MIMMSLIKYIWRIVKWTLGAILFVFLIQRSTYPLHLDWNAISLVVSDHKFDYLTWELEALISKASHTLWGQHRYMDEAARSQFVRDYMADLAVAQSLEAQIDQLYLDGADISTLQAQHDALRDTLNQRQPIVENILESQISAVLIDQGFGVLGQLLPPISMRFTQMPNLLIVSRRDRIERYVELAIEPLPLAEIERIEQRVDHTRNVSSIVVPLGGMALYPAMIQESSDLRWVIETFAHEWIHHYFFFFPLGLNYFVATDSADPEALIINETAADIFGKAVADLVFVQYYPELLTEDTRVFTVYTATTEFDFGAEMHITRVMVDQLMARMAALREQPFITITTTVKNQALIHETILKAEQYMEQRRLLFNANGYRIRKLNQAYFAFYGGYQGGIPGIGGEDPIGPAVQAIFAASQTLHDFAVTMRGITNRTELLSVKHALNIP
ncbi:MAG: hypothetical protein Kow00117_18570 [Phototrophicales bacterium]